MDPLQDQEQWAVDDVVHNRRVGKDWKSAKNGRAKKERQEWLGVCGNWVVIGQLRQFGPISPSFGHFANYDAAKLPKYRTHPKNIPEALASSSGAD